MYRLNLRGRMARCCCQWLFGACLGVGAFILPVQAQPVLNHQTQTDVLQWLAQYQPDSLHAGKRIAFSNLINELNLNRVVFVGEIHDRYDHHLTQLAVLQALHQRNPRLAIGVEWFQQSFQPVINDYLAGKIDEETLLRCTEYFDRWRYDYRMLRPIMQYAKDHHLAVIALNAPSEITRKVSRQGIAALTANERAQLPANITPPDQAYRSRLEKIFAEHFGKKQQLDNFLQVQRIWDETMAHNVTRFLDANPAWRMVVFAGAGHVSNDAGIPSDVQASKPQMRLATVLSMDARDMEKNTVDYAVLTSPLSLPPTGKLGVWLETKGKRVIIGDMARNSAVRKVGVRKGDRILTIDGIAIRNAADLSLELSGTKPGQVVKLVIEREAKEKDINTNKQLAYDVTLQ